MTRIVDATSYLPAIAQLGGELRIQTIDEAHRRAIKRIGLTPMLQQNTVAPYVNHARWIFDCPICDSGGAVVKPITRAWCFGCGSVFENVIWPSEIDDIVQTLEARPSQKNANWNITETVDQLKMENNYYQKTRSEEQKRAREQTMDPDTLLKEEERLSQLLSSSVDGVTR